MLAGVDLDVVDIMVPIELNFKITESVAKSLAGRRKGIICEKPLAPTLAQALPARDLVRTGRIGEVYYFIQNRVVDFPGAMLQDKFLAKEWRQHPEFPGGAIADTGVHDLAGLRHIFGPIDRLQAFGRPFPTISPAHKDGVFTYKDRMLT